MKAGGRTNSLTIGVLGVIFNDGREVSGELVENLNL